MVGLGSGLHLGRHRSLAVAQQWMKVCKCDPHLDARLCIIFWGLEVVFCSESRSSSTGNNAQYWVGVCKRVDVECCI